MIRGVVAAAVAALSLIAPTSVQAASCVPAAIETDSYCQLKSVRLHYIDYGGKGPVVILLAGLGSTAHIFDEFGPLLRQDHRVIADTRRGYGQSGDPADGTWGWISSMFRSAHPGGIHFAFADGSVHYISEAIDQQTYYQLGARSDGLPIGGYSP